MSGLEKNNIKTHANTLRGDHPKLRRGIWIPNENEEKDKRVKFFRYADYQVICCKDGRDAVRVQRALENRLKKFGLELNVEKTKTVTFNKREFPALFIVPATWQLLKGFNTINT